MFKKNRVEKTIAISLALHLLMLVSVSTHFPKVKVEQKLEIAFIQPKKQSIIPVAKNLEAPKVSLKMATQEIKDSAETAMPDAKFLSQHNQIVEHQTRAQKTGHFKNAKSVAHKNQSLTLREKIQENFSPPEQKQHLRTLSDAEIAMRQALDERPKFATTPSPKKENVEPEEEPSTSEDHIIADEGMETLINTREFKYYAYCKRIKDKIQVLWEPKIKAKVKNIDSGRSIASVSQEKITKTIIILDSQGTLERVQVIGASGLEDLDESAIEAFRAASPFPNPPAGIGDPDSKIRIRWDFVLN